MKQLLHLAPLGGINETTRCLNCGRLIIKGSGVISFTTDKWLFEAEPEGYTPCARPPPSELENENERPIDHHTW